jgi:hypothetical protein
LSKGKDFSAPPLPLWIGRSVRGQTSRKVLALFFLLTACCLNPNQVSGQDIPSANAGSIHGTVVNRVTREPIARALVFSPDNRFAEMTDDQGRFEFSFPQAASGNATGVAPPGVMISGGIRRMLANGPNSPSMLMARKPGFLPGDNYQPQYQPGEPSGQNVTITLIPEALIVGQVVLPTSEPPDRITVEIYRRQIQNGYGLWVSAGETQTKSTGEFRFSELPAGDYKLFTHELMDSDSQSFPGQQPYGYAPVYFPNASDFGLAGTIQLAAGKTFQAELSLVRQPYYPVKVAVADMPPGFYLDVQVWAQGRRGPGYSLGFNQQNQTVEGLLPNGTYTLQLAGVIKNLVSGSASITVHGGAFIGSGITVVPSRPIMVNVKEEFTSPDTSSPRQMMIGNHPFTVRGPRSYLTVTLEPAEDFGQNRGGGSLRPLSGPQDETLAIDNVVPGGYWVRVNSSRGYPSSVTSGGTDLLHQPLVVGPGGASSPIEITMRDDTAEIDGIVEGAPANSPASNESFAYVYCIPVSDSPGQFAQTGVSPDGKFNLQALAPGVYRVLAFRRQRADFEYLGSQALQAYDTRGQVVRLVAGQKEHLRLQLVATSE